LLEGQAQNALPKDLEFARQTSPAIFRDKAWSFPKENSIDKNAAHFCH
jgi:hypothetical protein